MKSGLAGGRMAVQWRALAAVAITSPLPSPLAMGGAPTAPGDVTRRRQWARNAASPPPRPPRRGAAGRGGPLAPTRASERASQQPRPSEALVSSRAVIAMHNP